MKKLFIAAFIFVSTFTTNVFAEVKMGIILGFTGPIESLTPAMAASAELAFKEASDSGSLLGGEKISVIRADSTCVDSAAATAAAEGVISQGVAAAESTQVESALITEIFFPPNSEPESEASLNASSADAAIAGVRDSIGPVNPKIIPILTSAKTFVVKVETNINAAINSFFIIFLFDC